MSSNQSATACLDLQQQYGFPGTWDTSQSDNPMCSNLFSWNLRAFGLYGSSARKIQKRMVSAFETLSTMVAIVVFSPSRESNNTDLCCLSGGTDSPTNTYAVAKLMSTKFPSTVLLMELSEQLRSSRLELHPSWIPRDTNVPADDLTNSVFPKFDSTEFVNLVGSNIPF